MPITGSMSPVMAAPDASAPVQYEAYGRLQPQTKGALEEVSCLSAAPVGVGKDRDRLDA